jgi:hypothetical protein
LAASNNANRVLNPSVAHLIHTRRVASSESVELKPAQEHWSARGTSIRSPERPEFPYVYRCRASAALGGHLKTGQ